MAFHHHWHYQLKKLSRFNFPILSILFHQSLNRSVYHDVRQFTGIVQKWGNDRCIRLVKCLGSWLSRASNFWLTPLTLRQGVVFFCQIYRYGWWAAQKPQCQQSKRSNFCSYKLPSSKYSSLTSVSHNRYLSSWLRNMGSQSAIAALIDQEALMAQQMKVNLTTMQHQLLMTARIPKLQPQRFKRLQKTQPSIYYIPRLLRSKVPQVPHGLPDQEPPRLLTQSRPRKALKERRGIEKTKKMMKTTISIAMKTSSL